MAKRAWRKPRFKLPKLYYNAKSQIYSNVANSLLRIDRGVALSTDREREGWPRREGEGGYTAR